SVISLPTERGSPARACATSSGAEGAPRRPRPPTVGSWWITSGEPPSGLRHADDQGVTLATAAAQGGRADASAATLQLEGEVEHDPSPGHADRVTDRDGAAVDVDLVLGDAQLTGGLDADRREGLVELEQVDVGDRDALLL